MPRNGAGTGSLLNDRSNDCFKGKPEKVLAARFLEQQSIERTFNL
jgi:hypothetical protein